VELDAVAVVELYGDEALAAGTIVLSTVASPVTLAVIVGGIL